MNLLLKNLKQRAQELIVSKNSSSEDTYFRSLENFIQEIAYINSDILLQKSNELFIENEQLRKESGDYIHINEELIQSNEELLESRKVLEEERDKALVLLQDLNDSQSIAKIGNWKWFVHENKLEWSDEMHRIFGIEKTNFSGDLAYVMSTCIHPEDRAKVEEINRTIAEKGEPITIEYRIILPDGSMKYIWATSGQIKKDQNNRVFYSSGIVQDITVRKTTEMKLIKMNEKLREQSQVMENAHILIRDMDNRIVYWNKGMEKLYGWSSDEIMNKVTHQLFQTIFPDSLENYQKELFEKRSWEGELIHTTHDGSILTVASHHTLFYDEEGNAKLIIEVNNDITAQKKTEQQLRESELHLKIKNEEYAALNEEYAASIEEYLSTNEELLQTNEELFTAKRAIEKSEQNFATAFLSSPVPQAITVLNRREIILVNDECCKLLAYSRDELMGNTIYKINLFENPEDRKLALHEIEKNGNLRMFETTIKNKHNESLTVLASVEKIIWKDQECVITSLLNISERKKIEKNLIESELNLKLKNEEYAALNEEYLTTNEELLQSNQELYTLKDQLEFTIEELKQANNDLKKAHKISKIGSWKWNLVENKLEWSDEMFQIFEIDKHSFSGNLGPIMTMRIHPDDRERVDEVNRLVMEKGTPRPLEYRLLLPGDKIKTVWAEAGEFQKSKEGKPLALSGIVQDITEWKNIIANLQESELRFSVIFQNSPIGISLMSSKTGAHVAVNKANLKIFGFTQDEILNRTSLELNVYENPEEREYLLSKLKNEGRLQQEEITIRKKTGELCIVQTSAERITINGEEYVLIMMSDITEHKKAEEKVKISERNLKLFVEYSPAAIAMFDNQMNYLVVSKRFLTDYNLKDFNIIGKSHYEIFPEISQYWKDIHKRCLQGAIEKNDEDIFPRITGEIDWLKWEIHPWYESKGKIGGILLFSEVITERKKSEIALKVSEEKFRNLFETIHVGIIFQNDEGKVQMMNQAAEKILETDLGQANETLNLLLQNATKENGLALEKEEFPAYLTLKTGEPVSNVLIQIKNPKSKKKSWLNTSSIPIISEETGKQFVYTIFEDITEQVNFNNESRKLRTAFAQSSSSFIITDAKGIIEDINSQTEIISGYSREEILSKTPALFKSGVHGKEFYENLWNTISSGNTWEGQICNKHKNGTLYWEYSVISPIRNENGNITHYFATQNDITEQKRDREELNKYRERLEIIVEERTKEIETVSSKLLNLIYSMPLGYIETDNSDNIISFNNSAENIFDAESKELIGKELSQIITFSPDIILMLQDSTENVNVFVHVHNINHKQITCRWNVVNLLDKYTGKLGKAFIIEDITKMKQAERSLHTALEKEKELNELKSGFVSMTSHQFRTPLTTILSNTELLEELISGLREEDKTKGKRFTKRIYDNIERLDLLMSDVLLIGKNQTGKVQFRPQNIQLNDFVQKIIADTEFPYQNGRATEMIIEGNEKDVNADQNLLSHIIHNLLSNAFKYSKENVKLKIEYFQNSVKIIVSDKGIGIPSDDQGKLFNSFFRASNTENLIGTGLGLVIVKEYVEMHKGNISFISELNKGSDFIVEIPYM